MSQAKERVQQSRKSDMRRKDLAIIHIAKKQLCMDDGTYRKMLLNVAGASSAADLDGLGRSAVIAHLKSCGFKPVHKTAKGSGMHRTPPKHKAALLYKIEAILAELKLPWGYVDGMSKKMFQIDKARWLDTNQLHKVMVALLYHQKRRR